MLYHGRTLHRPRNRRPATMANTLNLLTESLYASILDNPPWVDFLKLMEQQLPCHFGTMVLRKPREGDQGLIVSTQENSAAIVALQQQAWRDSPFLRLPAGRVCLLNRMMTPETLRTTHRTYYDYMMQYGHIDDLIGVDLEDPGTGMILGFRGARRSDEARFGDREARMLRALLPHLATATRLYARIAYQQFQLAVSDIAANRLAVGSLVLSESGDVITANATAEGILREEDGFRVERGVLHCTNAADDHRLHTLFRQIRAGDTDYRDLTWRTSRRSSDGHWSILVRPSAASVGIGEDVAATVLVLIRDAAQSPDVSVDVLMALFGFTRAEAQVAELLVKGASLDEAAEMLSRSRHTLRAQLSSIFDKTGIHRQPQLVGHILHTLNTAWV